MSTQGIWSRLPREINRGLDFKSRCLRRIFSHIVVGLLPGNDLFLGKDNKKESIAKPKEKRGRK